MNINSSPSIIAPRAKVSIVMPVNQDNEFLDAAIKSVLNQTYQNFELIIVANACTDEFLIRLGQYKNDKVKLIRTDFKFLPFALNFAIENAVGDYIARMDSDDICHPNRIEMQVKFLDGNMNVSIVGSNARYIDKNNVVFGVSECPIEHNDIAKSLRYKCSLIHPSIMMRKNIVQIYGGYMGGALSEDYDLWLRVARDNKHYFHNINEPLLDYRIHTNQATGKDKIYSIFCYDISLKLREFLLQGDFRFLMGMLLSFLYFIYNKYRRMS